MIIIKKGIKPLGLFSVSLLVIIWSIPQYLFAAGYQREEHSAEALGRANAGEAADDGVLASFRNPATMMFTKGSALSNALNLTKLDYDIDVTSHPYDDIVIPLFGPHETVLEPDLNNAGTFLPLPAFAYVKNKGNWAYGFASGAHFGYELNPTEISAIGPSFADIYIKVVHLTTNFAYKVNDQVNVGVGLSILPAFFKADRRSGELANVIQNALTIGDGIPVVEGVVNDLVEGLLGPLGTPDASLVRFNGTDIGWGWNIGLTYQPTQNTRFGLAYHHKADLTYDGDYQSDLSNINIPGVLELLVGSNGETIDGSVDTQLPSWLEFGAIHQYNENLELSFGASYTAWEDSIQEIILDAGSSLAEFSVPSNDTMRVSIGATYKLNDKIKIRGGFAKDKSFIEEPLFSTPDSDRTWFTAGLSYELNSKNSFDFSIAYQKFERNFNSEISTLFDNLDNASDIIPISALLGIDEQDKIIESTADASIIVLGLQYNRKF